MDNNVHMSIRRESETHLRVLRRLASRLSDEREIESVTAAMHTPRVNVPDHMK